MADRTQRILVEYDFQPEKVEAFRRLLLQVQQQSGLTEDSLREVAGAIQEQAQAGAQASVSIQALSTKLIALLNQERQLERQRTSTRDVQKQQEYALALQKTRAEITQTRLALNKQSEQAAKLIEREDRLRAARERANDPALVARYDKVLASLSQRIAQVTAAEDRRAAAAGRANAGRPGAPTPRPGTPAPAPVPDGPSGSPFSFALASTGVGAAVQAAGQALQFVQQLGVQAVSAAQRMETLKISFETFVGSAPVADEVIGKLREFANVTSFATEEIFQAGSGLLAFGLDADDLEPTLRRLGGVAAGLSIPLGDLVTVYGQIKTQNTVYTEDLLQLAGRGIPIFQQLAKQFGVAESEVKKLASEGKIGFKDIEQAFVQMTGEGGRFFGLLEKQGKSTAGLISTLQGSFQDLLASFGERSLGALNGVVSAFQSLVDVGIEYMSVPLSEKTKELQKDFNAEIETLKRATAATDDKIISEANRVVLIEQINEKYGPYLANQITEKTNVDEITKLQEQGNKVFEARIRLLAAEEVLNKRRNELQKAQAAELELALEQDRIAQGNVNTIDRLKAAYSDLSLSNGTLKNAGILLTGSFKAISGEATVQEIRTRQLSSAFKENKEEQLSLQEELRRATDIVGTYTSEWTALAESTNFTKKKTEEETEATKKGTETKKASQKTLSETAKAYEEITKQIREAEAAGKDIAQLKEVELLLRLALDEEDARTKTQSTIDRLRKQVENARLQIRIDAAGGESTVEGLRLIREQKLKEFLESKEYATLRIVDEQAAANKVLSIRQQLTQDVIAAAPVSEVQRIADEEISSLQKASEVRLAEVSKVTEAEFAILNQAQEAKATSEEETRKKLIELTREYLAETDAAFTASITKASIEQQRVSLRVAQAQGTAANLRTASADEVTQALSIITNEEERQRVQSLIDAKEYSQARAAIEQQAASLLVGANVKYAEETVKASRKVVGENQRRIDELKNTQQTVGLDASGEEELRLRSEQAEKLNDELLDAEKAYQDARLNLNAETNAELERQDMTAKEKRVALINAILNSASSLASATNGLLQQLSDNQLKAAEGNEARQREIEIRAFRRNKAIAIGMALIQGAQAVVGILAAPSAVPFPLSATLKAIAIGTTIATTGIQIATIAAQQPPGFKEGVFDLKGPGTKKSDSIPARLSRGEAVFPAETVEAYNRPLRAIFERRIQPRLVESAMVVAETLAGQRTSLPPKEARMMRGLMSERQIQPGLVESAMVVAETLAGYRAALPKKEASMIKSLMPERMSETTSVATTTIVEARAAQAQAITPAQIESAFRSALKKEMRDIMTDPDLAPEATRRLIRKYAQNNGKRG